MIFEEREFRGMIHFRVSRRLWGRWASDKESRRSFLLIPDAFHDDLRVAPDDA